MIYKITVKKTDRWSTNVEVGMNVEISSKEFSMSMRVEPFKAGLNSDWEVIRKAFMAKYGIDLRKEGSYLSTGMDNYLKCEPLG